VNDDTLVRAFRCTDLSASRLFGAFPVGDPSHCVGFEGGFRRARPETFVVGDDPTGTFFLGPDNRSAI